MTFARALLACSFALAASCGTTETAASDPALELFVWERGIGVRALGVEPRIEMSLWFYEWNLFDAFERGQFSPGRHELERQVARDGRSGTIRGEGLALELRVDDEGVALELEVTNTSDHDWPEVAALIACFNPGPPERRTEVMGHHRATFFLGDQGLASMPDRDMRFSAELGDELKTLSPSLEFDFSERWPTSEHTAHAGLLLRESSNGGWTSGIAWDRFVGVQAHNPWLCMHVAAQVGPLARGAKRTLRGRIYLFPGSPSEAFARYQVEFATHRR